jgi:hypothetical protein
MVSEEITVVDHRANSPNNSPTTMAKRMWEVYRPRHPRWAGRARRWRNKHAQLRRTLRNKTTRQWSNHVERCHGTRHTPCLPSRGCQRKAGPVEPKPAKMRSGCLLCRGMFYPGSGFSRHTNKEHRGQVPFVCLECSGQDGSKAVTTENWAAWMDHVAKVHGRDGQTGAEFSGQTVLGKRKRGGREERVRGTEKHLRLN